MFLIKIICHVSFFTFQSYLPFCTSFHCIIKNLRMAESRFSYLYNLSSSNSNNKIFYLVPHKKQLTIKNIEFLTPKTVILNFYCLNSIRNTVDNHRATMLKINIELKIHISHHDTIFKLRAKIPFVPWRQFYLHIHVS